MLEREVCGKRRDGRPVPYHKSEPLPKTVGVGFPRPPIYDGHSDIRGMFSKFVRVVM
jgi:hypothetical protein